MITVESIIEKCGGVEIIASRAYGLKAPSIHKWKLFGIPEKHWAVILELHKGRLTCKNLHDMNERMREANRG